jgi:predicted Holliday junction resolvase-like endonuclease
LSTDIVALASGVAIGLLSAWIYIAAWKTRYTAAIRDDAVHRSLAVTSGKVHEQLLPYLPGFPFNPKDVRFLGSPVDLIVFDGLAEGQVRRIVFAEVKTGSADLTERERRIRDVVSAGEVEWAELRVTRPVSAGAIPDTP